MHVRNTHVQKFTQSIIFMSFFYAKSKITKEDRSPPLPTNHFTNSVYYA